MESAWAPAVGEQKKITHPIYTRMFISHKEEANDVIFQKMDGTGREHHFKQDNVRPEGQIACFLTYVKSKLSFKKGSQCQRGTIWEERNKQFERDKRGS